MSVVATRRTNNKLQSTIYSSIRVYHRHGKVQCPLSKPFITSNNRLENKMTFFMPIYRIGLPWNNCIGYPLISWNYTIQSSLSSNSWDISQINDTDDPPIQRSPRPSKTTTTNSNNTATSKKSFVKENHSSAKQLLKSIPVDPLLLRNIDAMELGRLSTKQKRQIRQQRRRRQRQEQGRKTEFDSVMPPPPPPPPPFGHGKYLEENVQILPVKVLGSVGSALEEFPRSSKGLAEVAVAGRSNVGKSTLLNALLYSSRMRPSDDSNDDQNKKTGRRRHPLNNRGKIRRGIKAVVSPRPGETKRVTFYQLSCQVHDQSSSKKNATKQEDIVAKPTSGRQLTIGDSQTKTTKLAKQEKTAVTPNKSTSKLSLLLIDLPGYGYAYGAPIEEEEEEEEEDDFLDDDDDDDDDSYTHDDDDDDDDEPTNTPKQKKEDWRELTNRYVLNRGPSLKRILLLIDARHGMKHADVDFLSKLQHDWLEQWKRQQQKQKQQQSQKQQNNGQQQSGNKNRRKDKTLEKTTKPNITNNGLQVDNKVVHIKRKDLPPIQIVLTKCDLIDQEILARRIIQVRQQLSICLLREPSSLPVMLVSASNALGYHGVHQIRRRRQKKNSEVFRGGGILELQRELASLVITTEPPKKNTRYKKRRKVLKKDLDLKRKRKKNNTENCKFRHKKQDVPSKNK